MLLYPSSIVRTIDDQCTTIGLDSFTDCLNQQHSNLVTSRRRTVKTISDGHNSEIYTASQQAINQASALSQWKRIMLLVRFFGTFGWITNQIFFRQVIAITVHNIPEGLAVGVSFGAIGNSESATFEKARNLAIGIGIQNFPEGKTIWPNLSIGSKPKYMIKADNVVPFKGLAVSLPLHAAGFSMCRAFWYGQLSGMVEPIFGILGAVAVTAANIILPYALSFAAGAMIYIVADDILPEAHTRYIFTNIHLFCLEGNSISFFYCFLLSGNGMLATWGTIIGFILMMSLDVGLG